MAIYLGSLPLQGSIESLTFYKRRDLDRTCARFRTGPSRKEIKEKPKWANTRKMNSEFGIRAAASSVIMSAIYPLKQLADYNIAGPLNAMFKPIQELDTKSNIGQRDIHFTQWPKLLEGFSFNQKNPLESIVRAPITATASKETGIATVNIPPLLPGLNFVVPDIPTKLFSHYKLVVVFSRFYDVYHGVDTSRAVGSIFSQHIETEWNPCLADAAAQKLELTIPQEHLKNPNEFSLLLSIGIAFGKPWYNGQIRQEKHAGAGKILLMC